MRRLLSLLVAQTSGLLSMNRLASELSISAPTVPCAQVLCSTVALSRSLSATLTCLPMPGVVDDAGIERLGLRDRRPTRYMPYPQRRDRDAEAAEGGRFAYHLNG